MHLVSLMCRPRGCSQGWELGLQAWAPELGDFDGGKGGRHFRLRNSWEEVGTRGRGWIGKEW